eukprot:13371064-Alexandrium_andersonii.AAC.1
MLLAPSGVLRSSRAPRADAGGRLVPHPCALCSQVRAPAFLSAARRMPLAPSGVLRSSRAPRVEAGGSSGGCKGAATKGQCRFKQLSAALGSFKHF